MNSFTDLETDILYIINDRGEITTNKLYDRIYTYYGRELDKDQIRNRVHSLIESDAIRKGGWNETLSITDYGGELIQYQRYPLLHRGFSILKNEGLQPLLRRTYGMLYRELPPTYVLQLRKLWNKNNVISIKLLKKYYIDPDVIRLRTDGRIFSNKNDRGKVVGGQWDLNRFNFKAHPVFKGLRERFKEEKDWTQTAYYEWAGLHIDTVGRFFGCDSRNQFLKNRCAFVDSLYKSIQMNGYRVQEDAQLADTQRQNQRVEMTVNVDRNGELLIYDGHHRLAIAKILNLDAIPVNILVRHKQWQAIRDEVAKTPNPEKLPMDIKKHLPHPDLEDLIFTDKD